MCAARAREIYEREAKERQALLNGKSQLPANLPEAKKSGARDAAGKAFGTRPNQSAGQSITLAVSLLILGMMDARDFAIHIVWVR